MELRFHATCMGMSEHIRRYLDYYTDIAGEELWNLAISQSILDDRWHKISQTSKHPIP